MRRLPYSEEIKIKNFTPDKFDKLASHPFCFFLDSSGGDKKRNRYSFFGIDPVRTFISTGGFVQIDGRTFIDNPIDALRRFEATLKELPNDPYLPFSGGLVGFVSYGWPNNLNEPSPETLPDAWFGLFDTVITFDHLEESCWISSLGVDWDGTISEIIAKDRIENILTLLDLKDRKKDDGYIIKSNVPGPISNFTKDDYINAIETAKSSLHRHDWDRANLARRFHAPVAKSGWSIHKFLREWNPSPYGSFLRCGNFEISSTSPSGFLKLTDQRITCSVVQKNILKSSDPVKDRIYRSELLAKAQEEDPIARDEELSIGIVMDSHPELTKPVIESDSRSHYLVNKIEGHKKKGALATDCLTAALPCASMTGVPKLPVNNWLAVTEPSKRQLYTGAIGYIDTNSNAQFNTAVRTMVVKDQVAYVHSGWQINETTEAEEAFEKSQSGVENLFEKIRGLGE